ncbi:TIR-only protein-like [Impatiens glandulifera]|uniref:TIR-only protein-like n=1 Tax=Impatiens glandulifera TaxID=253017 RepID=UPI001FB074FD|nr:TIR-only protein-like [Impatiens glandulifera]
MQRSAVIACRKILRPTLPTPVVHHHADIFLNHRGVDTKKGVVGLLYNHFSLLGLRPFLDNKNMKPGDNLFEKIEFAIRKCKLGIAVFSPTYCHSYFCLHELSMIMECNKRVLPIFCDIKPSELRVHEDNVVNWRCSSKDLRRFRCAIEQAKNTVGLTFNSTDGNWSEFLNNASNAVMKNLVEIDGGEEIIMRSIGQHKHIIDF